MRAAPTNSRLQPIKRCEFRDAMGRLKLRRATARWGEQPGAHLHRRQGRSGRHHLAVTAGVLAQRSSHRRHRPDWIGNDGRCSSAPSQYTLMEVAENLERMDQALFEGFVTRDPLGLVGPPIRWNTTAFHRTYAARFRHLPGGEV
jgi:hypothetical protein